jgi:hypothetical protein
MESWKNTNEYNAYIQWIEYSLLTEVREMTSLRHGCTLMANWLDPTTNKLTQITLKQIDDTQSLDFHQVNYFTHKMIQIILRMHCTDCCNDCIVYSNS